jgi:hypothetical protein
MVDTGIFRLPTEEEKKDFKPIGRSGKLDYEHKFLKELADAEQRYIKQSMPFDCRCAQIDFNDKIEVIKKEIERLAGKVDTDDPRFERLFPFDYDKYAKSSRFELVDEREIMENKLIDGVRVPYKTAMCIDYKCKIRGEGISIFVPIDKYNEMKAKTAKEVKEVKEIKKEIEVSKDF